MAGSLIVRRLKLFETEDLFPARRGVGSRGAAHSSKANDNHVETGHRVGF